MSAIGSVNVMGKQVKEAIQGVSTYIGKQPDSVNLYVRKDKMFIHGESKSRASSARAYIPCTSNDAFEMCLDTNLLLNLLSNGEVILTANTNNVKVSGVGVKLKADIRSLPLNTLEFYNSDDFNWKSDAVNRELCAILAEMGHLALVDGKPENIVYNLTMFASDEGTYIGSSNYFQARSVIHKNNKKFNLDKFIKSFKKEDTPDIVLPISSFPTIAPLFAAPSAEVKVKSKSTLLVKSANYCVVAGLMSDEGYSAVPQQPIFESFKSFYMQDPLEDISIEKASSLKDAIDRISSMAEEHTPVEVTVSKGKMVISVESVYGSAQEEIAVTLGSGSKKPLSFKLNPRTVSSVLTAMSLAKTVNIKVYANNNDEPTSIGIIQDSLTKWQYSVVVVLAGDQ